MNNDCTVVILSYNVKDITDRSIHKAKKAQEFAQNKLACRVRIIVVDNASTDDTAAMIRKKYPDVMLLALKKNMGPAYGYNAGMKNAKTPYLLLINSDTMLNPSTIADALIYMNENSDCSVATGKITTTPHGAFRGIGGFLPSPFKTIRWMAGLESIPFVRRHLLPIYGFTWDTRHDQILEWIPTCFFFLRREVFTKTRGHDEKMFLYMEDTEWCKRIHDLGMKIYYTPAISAIHLGGASTSKKSEIKYLTLLQRNTDGLRYYHYKHHKATARLIDLFLQTGFRMRSIFYAVCGNSAKASAYRKVAFPEIS